jgi:hypothetical protein
LETQARLFARQWNVAGQAIEEATDRGKNAAAAMMDEAQQQGLTKDGLKSAAVKLSDSVSAVAKATRPTSE